MIHQDYANLRKIVSGDIIVKCRYGTDIRRIPISQAPSYDELCLMMYRLFKNKLSSPEDIMLKYTDDEGDLISMIDDTDVNHAISLNPLVKITVFDKTHYDLSSPQPGMQELKSQVDALIVMLKNLMESAPAQDQPPSSATTRKAPEKAYRPLSSAELAEFLDEPSKTSDHEDKTKPVQSPPQQQKPPSNHHRLPVQQTSSQQYTSSSQQVSSYPAPAPAPTSATIPSTSSQHQSPYPPQNYPPPPAPQQQSSYGVRPPLQQSQQQQPPPSIPVAANGGNNFPPQQMPGTPQTPVTYPPEQQQFQNYRVSGPSAPPSSQYYYPPPPQQMQQAPLQQRPQGWN